MPSFEIETKEAGFFFSPLTEILASQKILVQNPAPTENYTKCKWQLFHFCTYQAKLK